MSLEAAVSTLESEYEKCELVKIDAADLASKDLVDSRKTEFPSFMETTCFMFAGAVPRWTTEHLHLKTN